MTEIMNLVVVIAIAVAFVSAFIYLGWRLKCNAQYNEGYNEGYDQGIEAGKVQAWNESLADYNDEEIMGALSLCFDEAKKRDILGLDINIRMKQPTNKVAGALMDRAAEMIKEGNV